MCTTLPGITYRNNTRRQIGQLIQEASAKLKQASEADHGTQISVSSIGFSFHMDPFLLPLKVIYQHSTPSKNSL